MADTLRATVDHRYQLLADKQALTSMNSQLQLELAGRTSSAHPPKRAVMWKVISIVNQPETYFQYKK